MEPARAAAASAAGVLALGVLLLGSVGPQGTESGEPATAGQAPPESADAPPFPNAPGAVAAPGPPVLLPNLRSVGADDLRVEVTGSGARRLRFAASLANLGPGPLHLVPRGRERCPANQHAATQVHHVDVDGDGAFQRHRDTRRTSAFAGCMLRHRGHDHWHFESMAGYALRRPGDERPMVTRDKVSFCLRDNRRVPGQPVVVPRTHYGECSRTREQGISPGWVDVYSADLDGQWLRLPDGAAGLLCLDLRADPLNLVAETDETDNGTSLTVRVTGDSVRRATADVC